MSVAWQRVDWRSASACLSADPDLFFPISVKGPAAGQVDAAKAICAGCQVRADCLGFALAQRDMLGIWGGTTDDERRMLRRTAARREPSRAEPSLAEPSRAEPVRAEPVRTDHRHAARAQAGRGAKAGSAAA
jgi:WhiB family transcriptional regulator, redox-sensing transcriptional regulator